MQLKTILNRVQKHSSFVYGATRMSDQDGHLVLEVDIEARANGLPRCSGCGVRRPAYDRLLPRRFEFVPLWGILVFFVYAMRRVQCPPCGVVVEMVPWAEGKHRLTTTYRWFLAGWARRLSWAETARVFRTSWENVFRSVEMAVEWGRKHVDLSDISAIGIDEIAWSKGHEYLTLVYQINEGCRRLLWVGQHRKKETLLRFFDWFGEERSRALVFISSDMWKPYLQVIASKASEAVHVLDRYHIVAHLNKAIDHVRADEARRLKQEGYEPHLKSSRWLFLKRPENLTEYQGAKLADLVRYNLRTVRSYLLKEEFQQFWEYVSPAWAGKFLDAWCTRTMRSKVEPMKKVASMVRNHRDLILNWFVAKGTISSGTVEGFNNKAKLTTRKAFGFRTPRVAEIALFHVLGKLPEPPSTHRFC